MTAVPYIIHRGRIYQSGMEVYTGATASFTSTLGNGSALPTMTSLPHREKIKQVVIDMVAPHISYLINDFCRTSTTLVPRPTKLLDEMTHVLVTGAPFWSRVNDAEPGVSKTVMEGACAFLGIWARHLRDYRTAMTIQAILEEAPPCVDPFYT